MVFTTEIKLPNNVQVTQQSDFVVFQGPLGINKISLKKMDPKGVGAIRIKQEPPEGGRVSPTCQNGRTTTDTHKDQTQTGIIVSSPSKSFCGLISKKKKNKIQGVSRGFLIYVRV